jgi:hypothetical protein
MGEGEADLQSVGGVSLKAAKGLGTVPESRRTRRDSMAIPALGAVILAFAVFFVFLGPATLLSPVDPLRWEILGMGVVVFLLGLAHWAFSSSE